MRNTAAIIACLLLTFAFFCDFMAVKGIIEKQSDLNKRMRILEAGPQCQLW
jgi:hypothetical protein